MSFFSKIFSFDKDPKKAYKKELAQINAFADEVKSLSQDQMRQEISNYRSTLFEIKDDAEVLKKLVTFRPRVFALVREASLRATGKKHYDVQMMGGIALSDGSIAEMKTGEGKTLTATLPLVLFALAGKGAHLVTVNDFLARWQASQMGPIFAYLGLSVSSIQHEKSFLYDDQYQVSEEEKQRLENETEGFVMDVLNMRVISRREAYAADITYGTNNEYGFDYLRDNMAQGVEHVVQRDLFYAIVDEVDSILVDEARTPLIISMPDSDPTDKYSNFAKIVDRLGENSDYIIDEKKKATTLTDDGITKVEGLLGIGNIYDSAKNVRELHHVEQALKAKTLFKKDRDYVIRDGEVVIVDEFTGRLMFGRRYSEGLHQAIEAKEGVFIKQESKTLATITFQNLFRLYTRLSGMTGTAKTEEEEFFKIYRLPVIQIPTHRQMIRVDHGDVIYKTEEAKFAAIAQDIKERHQKGQPVLIGTVSIAKNELLAEYLKKAGVPFEILNAKNHEREAHIIAQAGRKGAVTLATNIAGRGVDILLGGNPVDPEEAAVVRSSGGLYVVGTERHESRRIDNQLRGRSGRQGDEGETKFYVSLDDDLMRLFGGDRLKKLMNTLGLPDDEPIENSIISRSIEQAQKKIEGLNFDTRKHVLEFDDVLNRQRELIYKKRKSYLNREVENITAIESEILQFIKDEVTEIVNFTYESEEDKSVVKEKIITQAQNIAGPILLDAKKLQLDIDNEDSRFALIDDLYAECVKAFELKRSEVGPDNMSHIMRLLCLQAVDMLWMEHLDTMDHLRDSVRLRGYGQRDPLVEYKREGHKLFQDIFIQIRKQVVYSIFKVALQPQVVNVETAPANTLPPDVDLSKVNRNDLCPCGSGLKYKKCHGK